MSFDFPSADNMNVVVAGTSGRKRVRSIQMWPSSRRRDAEEIRDQYFSWLPKFSWSLVRVQRENDFFTFKTPFVSVPILRFELNRELSSKDLQWLDIRGGLMAAKGSGGHLEFRVIRDGGYVVTAIHDYTPSLPWVIYLCTQAVLHELVMKCFEWHVERGEK